MKQHISVDQLLELTPAQQEALREWWKANLSTYNVGCYKFGRSLAIRVIQDSESMHIALDDSFECLPLLSLGLCIEFLREKASEAELMVAIAKAFHPQNLYRGRGLCCNWGVSDLPMEPIDSLFETIKAVLSCNHPKDGEG